MKTISTELLDEKLRMGERVKFYERENSQIKQDLEHLISRLEEVELENTRYRLNIDNIIDEEKAHILKEL